MLIATEIQKNFLPAELPVRPDLEFAALYRPAMDVGGDFDDVYEVGPDERYLVVGDVASKGVPAALLMALVGRIVPSRRRIEMASAGHCAPWIVGGGAVDELEVASGLPMAILPSALCASSALSLAPGEWLTVYTDGLTDSRSSSGDGARLGSAGARRLLEKEFANPRYVVATLSHGEASHRGDSPPQDDLTLLAFGFHA